MGRPVGADRQEGTRQHGQTPQHQHRQQAGHRKKERKRSGDCTTTTRHPTETAAVSGQSQAKQTGYDPVCLHTSAVRRNVHCGSVRDQQGEVQRKGVRVERVGQQWERRRVHTCTQSLNSAARQERCGSKGSGRFGRNGSHEGDPRWVRLPWNPPKISPHMERDSLNTFHCNFPDFRVLHATDDPPHDWRVPCEIKDIFMHYYP